MNYAIIAAGEGSRLAQEGVSKPKPLVDINGTPTIKRLIDIFLDSNAESVSIIVNEHMTEVRSFIESLTLPVPLNLVVKSTPYSMYSFAELSHVMASGRFCLTTVDTIFKAEDFKRYIADFEADDRADGYMAVTSYIDDEKPLYVEVDDRMMITAFRDQPWGGERYISGGIYGLTDKAFPVLHDCLQRGVTRMRDFQRALVSNGFALKAYDMGMILDVDHSEDLKKACRFLNGDFGA